MTLIPFPSVMMMNDQGIPPGTFLIGYNGATATSLALGPGDIHVGCGYQALIPGTVNSLVVKGSTTLDNPGLNFRLCIYDATSETVWGGALLGKTADEVGLGINEVKSLPLLTPVPLIVGNFYALTIHDGAGSGGGSAGSAIAGAYSDRYVFDGFADGPVNPIGASSFNSGNVRYLFGTT